MPANDSWCGSLLADIKAVSAASLDFIANIDFQPAVIFFLLARAHQGKDDLGEIGGGESWTFSLFVFLEKVQVPIHPYDRRHSYFKMDVGSFFLSGLF